MPQPHDFAVLGAGPAGSVLAMLLARSGYRVALIGAERRGPALEGLSARAVAGLAHAGCDAALAVAGAEVRRTAEWNGARFAGNRERLVRRERFDRALLEDTRAAGVDVHAGRVAGTRRTGKTWHIGWRARGGGEQALGAGYLIEARGRAAPACATALAGPQTFALARAWRLPCGEACAWVTSFADGWAWLARGERAGLLQVFVSLEGARLPPKSALAQHYEWLLGRIPGLDAQLGSAQPHGPVFARSAQARLFTDLIDAGRARVGDAALAIDPLAGHGIYEAVGGALALAAVLNTLRARPRRRALALAFYRDKMQAEFMRTARTARDFYRLETRWAEHAFWRERRGWPDAEPSHPPIGATAARVERRAVSENGLICEREVVVTADHPRGVWQLANVPLVSALRLAHGQRGVAAPELAALCAQRLDVSPADAQQALEWLRRRGLLVAEPAQH